MTEYSSNMNKMRTGPGEFHHHHHQICVPSYPLAGSSTSELGLAAATAVTNESYLLGTSMLAPATNGVIGSYNSYAEMLTNPAVESTGGLFSNFYGVHHQQNEYMQTSGQFMGVPAGGFSISTDSNGTGYSYPSSNSVWPMSEKKLSPPSLMTNGYPMSHDDNNTTSSSVGSTTTNSGSSTPTALTTLNGCPTASSQQLLKTSESNAALLTSLALADSSTMKESKTKQNNRAKHHQQQQFKNELQLCENEVATTNNNNTKMKMSNRLGRRAAVELDTAYELSRLQ